MKLLLPCMVLLAGCGKTVTSPTPPLVTPPATTTTHYVLLHWTGPGNVSWPACTTGKLPCNDHYTLRKNGVWVVNFPMSTLSTKQVYVKGVRWSLSVTAKDRYGVAKGSNQVFWLTP